MPNWVWICLGSGIVFALGFYAGVLIMAMMAVSSNADQAMERMMRDRHQ